MERKRSAFQNKQILALRRLKQGGHLDLGRLARRGSRVQHLVESLRLIPYEKLVFPSQLVARGYAPLTVHQALTRMELVGQAERVAQGHYRITGRPDDRDLIIDESDALNEVNSNEGGK